MAESSKSPQWILEGRQLSKIFKTPKKTELFSGVHIQVASGESVAITGRSGSGKTTLLHILGTLEQPSSGEVYIAGERIGRGNVDRIRSLQLGFVFQSFHLIEDETVLDNVLLPARIAGLPTHRKSLLYREACRLLEQVGISHRKDYLAKVLSGGEKQRVGLARACCLRPPLILADEPTGNLDAETGCVIQSLLFELTDHYGAALVVVTHDEELASRCTRRHSLSENHRLD